MAVAGPDLSGAAPGAASGGVPMRPGSKRGVAEFLRATGWRLARQGKHMVYQRVVVRDASGAVLKQQTLTVASTPSTHRHALMVRAQVRRAERAALTYADVC